MKHTPKQFNGIIAVLLILCLLSGCTSFYEGGNGTPSTASHSFGVLADDSSSSYESSYSPPPSSSEEPSSKEPEPSSSEAPVSSAASSSGTSSGAEGKDDGSYTPISSSEYYWYWNLNKTEQTLYKRILEAVDTYTNKIDVSDITVTIAMASKVLNYFVMDYPHKFWIGGAYNFSVVEGSNNIVGMYLTFFDGILRDDFAADGSIIKNAGRLTIDEQRKRFEAAADEVIASIPAGSSALDREKYIYDYVASNVKYDDYTASTFLDNKNGDSTAFNAYGALISKTAVCEGYSELFQYLCYKAGIQCLVVIGTSRSQPHQWNLVKLGDGYKHVDVTWGSTLSQGSTLNYDYFNLTQAQITKDHRISTSETIEGVTYYMVYPQS